MQSLPSCFEPVVGLGWTLDHICRRGTNQSSESSVRRPAPASWGWTGVYSHAGNSLISLLFLPNPAVNDLRPCILYGAAGEGEDKKLVLAAVVVKLPYFLMYKA